MSQYEYMVIPAPRATARTKGIRGTDALVAHDLTAMLNDHATEGWEFCRTETMTVETKPGYLSRPRLEQATVMIFRRPVEMAMPAHEVPQERHDVAGSRPGGRHTAAEPAQRGGGPALTATRRSDGPFPPLGRPGRP